MIIDLLEPYFANRAKPKLPINVFRASSAGYCTRRLGYDKLGIEGEPITSRRAAVFQHGHIIDGALKHDIEQVLGDRFINLDKLPYNHCEIGGVKIWFMPDGAFQTNEGEIGIIEIKTMSDYAFERAMKGQIDHAYLCQAWCYHKGTSFNPIVFICYRKETSHFCEVVFDSRVRETVVTQRFGGDPRELCTNDPLLIAKIRSPFDESVEAEVTAKFKHLAALQSEADLAPRLEMNDRGEPVVQDETVKVQGKEKAAQAMAEHPEWPVGTAKVSGSWYSFETGRKILGFPCGGYCPHMRRCYPGIAMEMKGDRPQWVINTQSQNANAVTNGQNGSTGLVVDNVSASA